MAIEYTPQDSSPPVTAIDYDPQNSSGLVSDPAEGGSFSASNDAELAGAQSFAAQAKLSETAAATSATNAATSETNAANSATAAATSATESATSATASATSATQSATSATASANSATAAATSETNAATSATNASNSATAAATSATNAATSETNAATSATAASNSATAAATSATNAATSETNAANSATAAATSATNAATSATAASNSATSASTSATAAATSETNAANSATAAATSATDAATSATAAANSATASATSATASAGSATNASNSATSAATAQTAAESARDAALAAFDSFDDRYLGQKSSDPSTDNDGNALVAGTLYFNTTTDAMMVYEGSSWVAAYASLSGALIANNNLSDLNNAATARTNLGLGTIATAAATDYVPVTGGTFTGNVESPEFIGTIQGEVVFKAKAGEAISKGDAVYVSGISGTTPVVSKADANDSSKMPAFGLSADTVSTNAAMEVVILGQLTNIDTSSFSLGDTLYISDTPGVLSATKPTGESSQLQNIGKVERVHATTGSILVSGSGRSAATPNLNDGNFFLGNSSNQSVPTDFTTAVLGEISAGTGISISGSGVISNSLPFTSADNTKLSGIETGATADQTAGEIKTAYESNADTNAFTDADHSKLDGIEASADVTDTANVTAAGALMDSELTSEASVKALNQGVATTDSPSFAGLTVDTDTLSVDATNNRVGIGTSSPSKELHVQDDITELLVEGTNNSVGTTVASVSVKAPFYRKAGLTIYDESDNEDFFIGRPYANTNEFVITNDGTERMRIDSSGRVGIGTTSPSRTFHSKGASGVGTVAKLESGVTTGTETVYLQLSSTGQSDTDSGYISYKNTREMGLWTADTERMTIDSSGNVDVKNGLEITGGPGTIAGSTFDNGWFRLGTSSQGLTIDTNEMYTSGSGDFNFGALGTGKWKFITRPRFTNGIDFGDSSPVVDENGNYLRITTSYGYTDIGSNNSSYSHFYTDRGKYYFNKRLIVDEGIISSYDDDLVLQRASSSNSQIKLDSVSNVGRILVKTNSYGAGFQTRSFYGTTMFAPSDTGDSTVNGFAWSTSYNSLFPARSNNTSLYRDNVADLGLSGARWDDIYATNGTIQTSDEREKQDIEALNEAEQRVAVAAKGLLRKFRWKDKVAAKGDDARIHFGIIAQDLEAAFIAEGLDPSKYAMFIKTEWWVGDKVYPAVEEETDEEGNVITEAVEESTDPEHHYDNQADAPADAVYHYRMGIRYSELLAFIISAI